MTDWLTVRDNWMYDHIYVILSLASRLCITIMSHADNTEDQLNISNIIRNKCPQTLTHTILYFRMFADFIISEINFSCAETFSLYTTIKVILQNKLLNTNNDRTNKESSPFTLLDKDITGG